MNRYLRLGRSLAPARERSTPTNRDIRQRMRSKTHDGDEGSAQAPRGNCLGDAQMLSRSEAAYLLADFAMALNVPRHLHGRATKILPLSEPPCGRACRRPALRKPRPRQVARTRTWRRPTGGTWEGTQYRSIAWPQMPARRSLERRREWRVRFPFPSRHVD